MNCKSNPNTYASSRKAWEDIRSFTLQGVPKRSCLSFKLMAKTEIFLKKSAVPDGYLYGTDIFFFKLLTYFTVCPMFFLHCCVSEHCSAEPFWSTRYVLCILLTLYVSAHKCILSMEWGRHFNTIHYLVEYGPWHLHVKGERHNNFGKLCMRSLIFFSS